MPEFTADAATVASETDPKILIRLAAEHPELRATVYQNPFCPEDLKKHLEDLGRSGADPSMATFLAKEPSQKKRPTQDDPVNRGGGPPLSLTQVSTAEASPPVEKKRRLGTPLFVVGVMVLAALALWLLWGLGVLDGVGQTASAGSDQTGVTEAGPAAEETADGDTAGTAGPAEANPSEEVVVETPQPVKPIPSDALSYAFVDTPSKNISCELTDQAVSCSVFERHYFAAGLQDCDAWLFSIVVDDYDVSLACGQEFLGEVGMHFYELQYGETTAQGDFACNAETTGVTCWNQMTGADSVLNRDEYSVF